VRRLGGITQPANGGAELLDADRTRLDGGAEDEQDGPRVYRLADLVGQRRVVPAEAEEPIRAAVGFPADVAQARPGVGHTARHPGRDRPVRDLQTAREISLRQVGLEGLGQAFSDTLTPRGLPESTPHAGECKAPVRGC